VWTVYLESTDFGGFQKAGQMILLVTVDKNRPKAMECLQKLVDKQTTQDFDWLIVIDGWEGYKFPKKAKVIKRDNSEDTLPSICENWLNALDWIEAHEQYDKIIILEDDWYHREYVLETAALLDKGDLAGWCEDAYYYVLSRKARRCHNVNFAALASTAFNRSVIPYMRECCQLGTVFIDKPLWLGISETSMMPQPPLTLANGQVVSPPPVQYTRIVKNFNGKRVLADNFTGLVSNEAAQIKWEDGKMTLITNAAVIDNNGNIVDEHPRHVGLKEPWHGGNVLSNHDARQGGGPDIYGDKLKQWLKEDAKVYLAFTRDPPRNPYPPNIMVPMPIDNF
jgi:hypothetical protein